MGNTQRSHPTGQVIDGGKVCESPACAIDGFAGGKPKVTQTSFPAHPSTPVRQVMGNTGNGHPTQGQPARAPISADDCTGKHFEPVGSAADADLASGIHDEAVFSGSGRLPGEDAHWRPSRKNLIGD